LPGAILDPLAPLNLARGIMSRISYETVQTLIYDPVSANRAATRASLYSLGFRHIESVAAMSDFTDSIKRRPPDLAFCEAQGADTELCATIQSMRQGLTGHNPFVVIIVTAWENSTALVTRVLNSGADDLLLRPFSAGASPCMRSAARASSSHRIMSGPTAAAVPRALRMSSCSCRRTRSR
jgi:CheY-like chemotaxis protein